MEHSLGDPAHVEQMKDYLHGDAQLDVPTDNVYDRRRADYQRYLDVYFNGIGSAVTGPLTKYEDAYRDALR
jgi:hypothetical protein